VAIRVITAAAGAPVSLAEAKAHLRLEESVDDVYVMSLIETARLYVEQKCERALLLQTVELTTEELDWTEPMSLPGGHLADDPQVVVQYLDIAGALQLLASTEYYTLSGGDACPGELLLVPMATWPVMADREDAIRVQYRVGWATAAAVPAPLRHAVLLVVSQLYEHRTPEVTGAVATTLAFSLDALMAPYRFRGI
jgi:uncharacterized phiE125 gp8 family phage protein